MLLEPQKIKNFLIAGRLPPKILGTWNCVKPRNKNLEKKDEERLERIQFTNGPVLKLVPVLAQCVVQAACCTRVGCEVHQGSPRGWKMGWEGWNLLKLLHFCCCYCLWISSVHSRLPNVDCPTDSTVPCSMQIGKLIILRNVSNATAPMEWIWIPGDLTIQNIGRWWDAYRNLIFQQEWIIGDTNR